MEQGSGLSLFTSLVHVSSVGRSLGKRIQGCCWLFRKQKTAHPGKEPPCWFIATSFPGSRCTRAASPAPPRSVQSGIETLPWPCRWAPAALARQAVRRVRGFEEEEEYVRHAAHQTEVVNATLSKGWMDIFSRGAVLRSQLIRKTKTLSWAPGKEAAIFALQSREDIENPDAIHLHRPPTGEGTSTLSPCPPSPERGRSDRSRNQRKE